MKKIKQILLLLVVVGFSQPSFSQGSGIRPPIDTLQGLRDALREKAKKIRGAFTVNTGNTNTWQYRLRENMGEIFEPLAFNKQRPVVVVLIHGVTGKVTTDNRIGTLVGARNYWSYDFVDGIFGDTRKQEQYTTFDGNGNAGDYLLKPQWETRYISNNNPLQHFITLYGKPDSAKNFYTPISVMLTYRDGSLPMDVQLSATAQQIVTNYQAAFGNWPTDKKPQIILLCHSFGGVLARAICSAPTSIPAVPNPSSSRIQLGASFDSALTNTDFLNFEFIRNKTLHITTLSTPHEGSPITAVTSLATEFLNLTVGMGSFPIVSDVKATDPDRVIMKQLTTSYLQLLNTGILRPDKCKRRDGSLIPIHALGGRTPAGSNFFSNPNFSDGGINNVVTASLLEDESNRNEYESKNLVSVDIAIHNLPNTPLPWGITPSTNTRLDRVSIRELANNKCLVNRFNIIDFLNPKLFYLRQTWNGVGINPNFPCGMSYTPVPNSLASDGEIDHDGFVPINSSLGSNLGTSSIDFFEHTSNWNNNSVNVPIGSWYRFYSSGADFHNHGSIKFDKKVSVWLNRNIFGFNTVPFITAIGSNGAGPRVAIAGTVSSW